MPLPLMIEELMKPEAYPEPPGDARLIQTHISFVILTDRYVYKIKKRVNFGFLDFTTLERRRFYCRQELELNRRLSPEVYLELLDIREKGGHFLYDGEGEIVDYAVKMRRLPDDRMMINLLKAGKVDEKMLDVIAGKVAAFHAAARTDPAVTSCGSLDSIRKNVEENFSQTERYVGVTISEEDYNSIKNYSEAFLRKREALFLRRMADGRIRDCHGDLHMDHLYIMDKIQIIDCIEFNERFRYSDVAADVAFLAMDLDFYGEKGLSGAFVKSYIRHSGDDEVSDLIDFYKCYRAYVRGKVDSFELDDHNLDGEEKEGMKGLAASYFRLAAGYVP